MKSVINLSLFSTFMMLCFVLTAQAQINATPVSLKYDKSNNSPQHKFFSEPAMVTASFPGGIAAWEQYIAKNLEYPLWAREHGVEGKVVVRFWVNTTGQTEDFEIVESLGYGCKKEVKRLIQNTRWNPAIQGERAVKSRMELAVRFALER